MEGYFFDTYSIIELVNGNLNYEKFSEGTIITSTLNLSEFYYALLRAHNEQTANYWINKLKFHLVNIIKLEDAIEASKFRFKYKKEKLSFIDCIGYVLAKKLDIKFLTGDEKFKNKENVEFVK